MIRVIVLIVCVGTLSCSSERTEMSKSEKARESAAERVVHFVKTADTTNFRAVFSDSLLRQYPIEGMLEERTNLIVESGDIKDVKGPFVDSSSEVRILINFEMRAVDVWLTFDIDQRIAAVDITNAPMCDSSSIQSGVQHRRRGAINDLDFMTLFANQFEADTGFVRLIALLSPT